MEIYTTVALIYFAVAFPATLITSYLERRIIARQQGADAVRTGRISWQTILLKTIPLRLGRGG
jgi:hypothetical protein